MRFADSLAWLSAGKSMLARMAIMAITTSNSMSVKPRDGRCFRLKFAHEKPRHDLIRPGRMLLGGMLMPILTMPRQGIFHSIRAIFVRPTGGEMKYQAGRSFGYRAK